jgi:hypothetical protein
MSQRLRLAICLLEDRATPAGSQLLVGTTTFVVGADLGSSVVNVRAADGTILSSQAAFGLDTGGVRVATADITGDAQDDYVMATGPGRPVEVYAVNTQGSSLQVPFRPFEGTFTGGAFVAAGDITGDGLAEVVITAGRGGGPRVRVYDGRTLSPLADFFALADTTFRGGGTVAVGDVNGDGRGDLAFGVGTGGSRVSVFDGRTIASSEPSRLFDDVSAFEPTFRGGVNVALGDLDGDGRADVIVGAGAGGGPRVVAFRAADLLQSTSSTPFLSFFTDTPDARLGTRLAVKNLNDDAVADLVVSYAPNRFAVPTAEGRRVKAFFGGTLATSSTPSPAYELNGFDVFSAGIFVG